MVSSYLVHHGYSTTAEKFAEITGQSFSEDINSIKTRQSMMHINLSFNIWTMNIKSCVSFSQRLSN